MMLDSALDGLLNIRIREVVGVMERDSDLLLRQYLASQAWYGINPPYLRREPRLPQAARSPSRGSRDTPR